MSLNFRSSEGLKQILVFVFLPIVCCAIYGEDGSDHEHEEGFSEAKASAVILNCDTQRRIGKALLRERASDEGVKTVDIVIDVRRGLTAGKHAVHIHETGTCDPCSAAGGHFDPGPHGFTSPDGNHPFHAGDLVNLSVDDFSGVDFNADGEMVGGGTLMAMTTRVTLSDGPLSLFDEDGSAFIIHTNPDTYCSDGEEAGCAGGSRAACGIIQAGGLSEDDSN